MRDSFFVFVFVTALVVSVIVIGVIESAPDDPTGEHSTFRPALHAALNGTCAAVLLVGFWMIRHRKIAAHLVCMVLAGLLTATFLVSYLDYHAVAGSTKFQGQGLIRPGLLCGPALAHRPCRPRGAARRQPVLVCGKAPSVETSIARSHRVTLPIWVYTSITGVLVYYMLHVWF